MIDACIIPATARIWEAQKVFSEPRGAVMLLLHDDIRNDKYQKLIDYLNGECECMSFHFPNLFRRFITPKNAMFGRYTDEYSDLATEDTDIEYVKYRERTEKWLEKLRDYKLRDYHDVEYLDNLYGYRTHIYVFEMNDITSSIVKTANGLSDWKFPDMPEDLCFHSRGLCRLRSVAHENMYDMYLESSRDKRALKMMGIDYDEDPEYKPRIAMP